MPPKPRQYKSPRLFVADLLASLGIVEITTQKYSELMDLVERRDQEVINSPEMKPAEGTIF